MKVTLTFEEFTRNQAFEARLARGLNKEEDRDTFFGPEFEDANNVYEQGDWVKVILNDNSEYWYPKYQIVRVKIEQDTKPRAALVPIK